MLLTYAANLRYQLGMLAFAGFEPGHAALWSVLKMHNSWKDIYISKINFINSPELNFNYETRKRKTRDIHNSKKGIYK
jgi:hypothetical protein